MKRHVLLLGGERLETWKVLTEGSSRGQRGSSGRARRVRRDPQNRELLPTRRFYRTTPGELLSQPLSACASVGHDAKPVLGLVVLWVMIRW